MADDRCLHCNQPVRLINYAMGEKWMHVDPAASFPTERKGSAWHHCRQAVATVKSPLLPAPALGTAGEADPHDDADQAEAPCAHTWTFANTPGVKICQLCGLCERVQSPDRGRAYTTALYDQEPPC